MIKYFANYIAQLAAGCVLLMTLLALGPGVSHAQIVFEMELSEKGKKAVTDADNMDAEMLLGLLSKEGRIVSHNGQEDGREREKKKGNSYGVNQTHLIIDADRKILGRVEGKSFTTKAGTHPMGKSFPRGQFLAVLKKAFPDSIFFPDSVFFPDANFFPDSTFNPGKQFPDSVFDKMGLKEGQIGIVSSVVSADGDRDVQSRPMVLVLSPAS